MSTTLAYVCIVLILIFVAAVIGAIVATMHYLVSKVQPKLKD